MKKTVKPTKVKAPGKISLKGSLFLLLGGRLYIFNAVLENGEVDIRFSYGLRTVAQGERTGPGSSTSW